jgi:acylphosphatase
MKIHRDLEVVRIYIIVSGKVQGVGFRRFVVTHAMQLNLSGYCKNLPSGEVEIDVEGPSGKVQELVRQLHIGPSRGQIAKVTVSSPLEPQNGSTFIIRY